MNDPIDIAFLVIVHTIGVNPVIRKYDPIKDMELIAIGFPSIISDYCHLNIPTNFLGAIQDGIILPYDYIAWNPPLWNIVNGVYITKLHNGRFTHNALKYGGFSGCALIQANGSIMGIHHSWDPENGIGFGTTVKELYKLLVG